MSLDKWPAYLRAILTHLRGCTEMHRDRHIDETAPTELRGGVGRGGEGVGMSLTPRREIILSDHQITSSTPSTSWRQEGLSHTTMTETCLLPHQTSALTSSHIWQETRRFEQLRGTRHRKLMSPMIRARPSSSRHRLSAPPHRERETTTHAMCPHANQVNVNDAGVAG